MSSPLRVTIWNEFIHEQTVDQVRKIYPDGLHAVIAATLESRLGTEVRVRVATLDEPEHGLTYAALAETDVLLWWGHAAHERVEDNIVQRVHDRVLHGMGFVALHSAHNSKIFRRLMGTSCMLRWREAAEKERVWVIDPGHPVVAGLRDRRARPGRIPVADRGRACLRRHDRGPEAARPARRACVPQRVLLGDAGRRVLPGRARRRAAVGENCAGARGRVAATS